jgi:hypothetical protein
VTIWKYPLTAASGLRMPRGARLLTVQVQAEDVCLWALVDPEAPMVTRTIRVFGTGHTVKLAATDAYIGTFQLSGGALVFHAFDGGEAL